MCAISESQTVHIVTIIGARYRAFGQCQGILQFECVVAYGCICIIRDTDCQDSGGTCRTNNILQPGDAKYQPFLAFHIKLNVHIASKHQLLSHASSSLKIVCRGLQCLSTFKCYEQPNALESKAIIIGINLWMKPCHH